MASRIVIPGLLMLLAGLAAPGCISAEKMRLLSGFPNDPVADLESPETPRVSRSQSPTPLPPLAPTVNPPPPLPSAGNAAAPGSSILYPPPLVPVKATTPLPAPPPTVPASTPPPLTTPPAQPIQAAANKVAAPEIELPGQPAYQVKVAAWVNGKPIFYDDIVQAILPEYVRLKRTGHPEAAKQLKSLFDNVLEQFIDRDLLYQDAIGKLSAVNPKAIKNLKEVQKKEFEKRLREIKTANHWTDEDFMQNLRHSGMTLERMERSEERRFFADEYLRSRVFPLVDRGTSYTILWEYYVNHQDEFKQEDSVNWQDIFIAIGTKRNPTREHAYRFAMEIANRIRQGEDMARFLEFDDGDSKVRNGDGAGHRPDQIQPPELSRYLFAMREGELGPIVEISTGFHVIRLSKREFAGPIPFDEKTQRFIRNKLRSEIFEREARRIHRELRSRAVIERTAQ